MGEVVAELRERARACRAGRACGASGCWSTPASASRRRPSTASRRCAGWPSWRALDRPMLVGPSRKSFIGRGARRAGRATADGHGGRGGGGGAARRPRGARPRRARDGRGGAPGRRRARRRPTPRGPPDAPAARLASWPAPSCAGGTSLDILLVAFIVYQLLQFIRGTHAVQIALGGLVLVVLYWTSIFFNLQTVNWLLRTFLPFLVFGIIVVFQAEIRKGLAHLGRAPFLGGAAPPPPGGDRRRGRAGGDHAWPRSARARSSCSSARWGCAATSRPASRSTRW